MAFITRPGRLVLPGMVERDRGHIVNISITAAIYPYPGRHVYGASKASVMQFSLNLRADLVGLAVRVTDLKPGLCGGTEFSINRFGGDRTRASAVYAGTLPLTAHDIAEAAAWVISLPPHMNINRMEIMPTCQAPDPWRSSDHDAAAPLIREYAATNVAQKDR